MDLCAAGNQNWNTQILGESADYFTLRQWPLSQGAPFSEQDVRSANKVAVVGQTIVDRRTSAPEPKLHTRVCTDVDARRALSMFFTTLGV